VAHSSGVDPGRFLIGRLLECSSGDWACERSVWPGRYNISTIYPHFVTVHLTQVSIKGRAWRPRGPESKIFQEHPFSSYVSRKLKHVA